MGVSNSDLAFGCGRKLEDSSEDCGHSFASGPRIVPVYKRGPMLEAIQMAVPN